MLKVPENSPVSISDDNDYALVYVSKDFDLSWALDANIPYTVDNIYKSEKIISLDKKDIDLSDFTVKEPKIDKWRSTPYSIAWTASMCSFFLSHGISAVVKMDGSTLFKSDYDLIRAKMFLSEAHSNYLNRD